MMKATLLISVYITNYNYGAYIRQSIESVLAQTCQDFELLIIDDGSTDDSREIIEAYRHHPKVSIIYQHNKGLNVTNNIAMRAARGKYIMRLDADDYLAPDALEVMSAALEKDPELGLVFPDYYYIDAKGNITGEERRHNFDAEVSLYDQPAHGACTMIRLQFLQTLGGYNESFTCQDGYDLWIKFIMHHRVTNINKPLFFYRRHGNNLTEKEDLILTTRKRIKELYVKSYRLTTPTTVAIIPVRETFIGGVNWPLYRRNGKSILGNAVDVLLASQRVQWVVVTSSDETINSHVKELMESRDADRLIVVRRPADFEKVSEPLQKTFSHVLDQVRVLNIQPEAIMSVSLEYPFLTPSVVDDAVNTLTIFKADSLLSVRPDNRMYYQHVGHGMVPILDQEKFTKLEREALYKGAGGVVLSTVENFRQNGKMIAGKVGHIVVDRKVAFAVSDEFDLALFNGVERLVTTVGKG